MLHLKIFVNCVDTKNEISQEFNCGDSLKQSMKLRFCGTSRDVVLFPDFQ
jgi:hypothetical protein